MNHAIVPDAEQQFEYLQDEGHSSHGGSNPSGPGIKRFFSIFETASSYLLRAVSITKYGLRTHVFSKNKDHDILLPVASKLSVFSVVNVFLTPWFLFRDAEDGVNAYKKNDSEGIALAVTSALANSGGGLDQFMTFFGGIKAINSAVPTVGWFETVMPPLGIALTSLGILTESHKLYHTSKIMKALEQVYDESSMQEFLNKHVGLPTDPKRSLKITLLERRSGIKGFEKMKTFEANKAFIKDAKTLQKRKIVHGTINWTAMVVTLVALSLLFSPIGPLVPLAMLLGCGVVKLGLMIYKEWYLKKNLNLKPSPS